MKLLNVFLNFIFRMHCSLETYQAPSPKPNSDLTDTINNTINDLNTETQTLADSYVVENNPSFEKEFSNKRKKSDYAGDLVQIMKENASMRRERYEKKLSASHDEVELFYISMAKIAKRLPKAKEAKLRMEVCNQVSEAELAYLLEVETQQQQNVKNVMSNQSPAPNRPVFYPPYPEYISQESTSKKKK